MPVINKATFDELRQMSGEDFINELIEAFLEDGPNMIAAMQAALDMKNAESFRRNAHSMKSNANTFGAAELAALAKELEALGRESNLDIGNGLEALKEAFGKAAEELKRMRV